jgi:transcriptional regulator with XRE-family HTH domain
VYTTAVGIKRTPRAKIARTPKEERPTEFGALIKAKRKLDKLSLRRAAAAIGIEHSGLSELERGMRRPDFETIAKVNEGLGIPLDELAVAVAHDQGHKPVTTEEALRQLAGSLTARAQMYPDLRKILDHLNKTDPDRYRAFLVMFQVWDQENGQDGENRA